MKLTFAVSPVPTFLVCCGALMAVSVGAHAAESTEKDFFEELPVVLSVTRLAQSAHDTPGAVTVIDADMIRRSGARELADVLKMVPGFLVAHRRGGDTTASYHSAMDEFGARMQVYVDGRSVYSSFYLGDTHRGIAAVQLADVARIEVLRGSNSAAYGSLAFLGVINVVTHAPADTHGVMVSYAGGEAGISDNYARVGWGNDTAHWRVSTSRRVTTGLENLYDDSRASQLQLRGDIRVGATNEFSIDAGVLQQAYGDGEQPVTCNAYLLRTPAVCDTNPLRTSQWRNSYARVVWNSQIDQLSSLRVSAGVDHEVIGADYVARQFTTYFLAPPAFPATGPVTLTLPFGTKGTALRHDVEVQRTDIWQDWRTVVGAEFVREEVRSPFLFSTDSSQASSQVKLFTSAEWKPSEQWTANISGLWERHNVIGDNFAPRLGVNYHLNPRHTLRAASTRSFRYPSIYMFRGNASPDVILSRVIPVPSPPFPLPLTTTLPYPYVAATGKVRAETLISNEVGYLGEFTEQNLRVDLRGFNERLNQRQWAVGTDFVNFPGPVIRGFEYQLSWTPTASTRIIFGEAHLRELAGRRPEESTEAPHRTGSFSVFHDFENGINIGVVDHYATPYDSNGKIKSRQLDVRVGYIFHIGTTRAEAALVTQAAGGSSVTNVVGGQDRIYDRRAFATLKLDF